MLIVGLTGGIGSGKTTVSNLFKEKGIEIIDTDVIAHELVNKDKKTLEEIVACFGSKILLTDGCLDRKQLANIVFNNNKSKQQLENILHPKIRNKVRQQIQAITAQRPPPAYLIIVIPLLFETGFSDLIDRVLVVMSDENIRINRIQQRDRREPDEIQSIINNQVNDEIRSREADDIIENNRDLQHLSAQVARLHKVYSQNSA